MKWEEKRFDEIGTVERGRSRHRPRNDESLYGGNYPFIQTGEVKAANLYISEFSQTYNEKGLGQSRLWQPGTLCITIAANIADTAILGIEACFPDSIIGFKADEAKSDVRFVKYFFDIWQKKIQMVSQGATQDNLSMEKLLKFKIPCPPLPTQQKIASILSAYDDLIENNLKRIRLLEEAAQHLYREWFVKFRFPGWEEVKMVDGLPEGWEGITIGDICKVKGGKRLPEGSTLGENNTGFPYIRVKDLTSRGVNLESVQFIDQKSQEIIKKYVITTDEIYISNAGTIGLAGIVPKSLNGANLTENCAKLSEIKEMCYKNYLCWFLRSTAGQGLLDSNAGGASQPKLALFRISKICVVLPEINILKAFDQKVELFSMQIESLSIQNQKLKTARDLLLPRLMSGSIEV